MKRFFLIFLCLFALFATDLLAKDTPEELEIKIRKTSHYAIPRTVLITVYVQVGLQTKKGYGSGGLISKDGYILTCSHVVELGSKVDVTLSDGRVFSAEKKGKNRKQDYALLKINPPKPLPYFSIGDSKTLTVGQWVVALGHPGGPYGDRKPAVAAGVITGLKRVLILQGNGKFYNRAIRTDVPIFMGNSGGPLIDLEGKIIGINGAIIMLNKNSYAIPIHQVMEKMSLLKDGKNFEGASPSLLDMQKMKSEISPQDMGEIYKRVAENFYRITLGKVVKSLKHWWKMLFPGKKK